MQVIRQPLDPFTKMDDFIGGCDMPFGKTSHLVGWLEEGVRCKQRRPGRRLLRESGEEGTVADMQKKSEGAFT